MVVLIEEDVRTGELEVAEGNIEEDEVDVNARGDPITVLVVVDEVEEAGVAEMFWVEILTT